MIKNRPAHNQSEITHIIGDVEDMTPIIIEDLIDTGSTIVNVVEALKKKARMIPTYVQHMACSQPMRLRSWIIRTSAKSLLQIRSVSVKSIRVNLSYCRCPRSLQPPLKSLPKAARLQLCLNQAHRPSVKQNNI